MHVCVCVSVFSRLYISIDEESEAVYSIGVRLFCTNSFFFITPEWFRLLLAYTLAHNVHTKCIGGIGSLSHASCVCLCAEKRHSATISADAIEQISNYETLMMIISQHFDALFCVNGMHAPYRIGRHTYDNKIDLFQGAQFCLSLNIPLRFLTIAHRSSHTLSLSRSSRFNNLVSTFNQFHIYLI